MPIKKSKIYNDNFVFFIIYVFYIQYLYCSPSLSLVYLIIAHMKLIDQQRHGELIVEKILQVLSSNPNEAAKRMIMTSLELIIDITMHDRVLGRLL